MIRVVKNSSKILNFFCFSSLFLCCYAPALFQDRQFGFRDAGHFYYPLHQRVQEEWNQGWWPLWAGEENASRRLLLGDPHGRCALSREVDLCGSAPVCLGCADLRCHAFGAGVRRHAGALARVGNKLVRIGSGCGKLTPSVRPILFQYCNVIYLVGAAWLPLGMHAIDRWVRLGRRWGRGELAIVLAMQVLGGDPQAAYLLGLSGAGYALGLAWSRKRKRTARPGAADTAAACNQARSVLPALYLIAAVLLWSTATIAIAILLPKLKVPTSSRGPRCCDGCESGSLRPGVWRLSASFISITGATAAGDARWARHGWD